MDVILLQRVANLGIIGDVVKVKDGYARNYLLPQGKAIRATEKNKQEFESRRTHFEAHNLELKREAELISGKMEGLFVTLIRQAGESGHLYGSVSARDIADSVNASGFTLRHSQVSLSSPIKAIGVYAVPIALHPEIDVNVTVVIARSEEEAKRVKEKLVKKDEEAKSAPAVEEVIQEETTPETVVTE